MVEVPFKEYLLHVFKKKVSAIERTMAISLVVTYRNTGLVP